MSETRPDKSDQPGASDDRTRFEWRAKRESCIVTFGTLVNRRRWRLLGSLRVRTGEAIGIGVSIGFDKAAAEAKDPRMELSTDALYDDGELVLCRGRHGTLNSPRCLGEADHGHISVGHQVATVPGGAIGRKMS
jgi:hypothetical protein